VAFGAVALFAAALLTFFALVPSYIILKMQEAGSSSAAAAQSSEIAAAKKDLTRSQGLVTLLTPIATSSAFLDAFNALLENRPRGAHLDSIIYTEAAYSGQGEIVLAGTSGGREDVNAYRIALEGDDHFTNVSVPVSALAGARDGHFSITLTGAF
jgi:Tfp pilus assembly protein PilN